MISSECGLSGLVFRPPLAPPVGRIFLSSCSPVCLAFLLRSKSSSSELFDSKTYCKSVCTTPHECTDSTQSASIQISVDPCQIVNPLGLSLPLGGLSFPLDISSPMAASGGEPLRPKQLTNQYSVFEPYSSWLVLVNTCFVISGLRGALRRV